MRTLGAALWALVFGAALCFCAASSQAVGGREVAEQKCSGCHDLKRLCRGLDAKDKRSWADTIARMVEKRGARLSPQEQTVVYEYLIRQTSKTAPFCKG